MLLLFSIRVAEWPAISERAIHSVYVLVLRKRLSICMSASFPFGFEGEMWNLIILVPDHWLFFKFVCIFILRVQSCKTRCQKAEKSQQSHKQNLNTSNSCMIIHQLTMTKFLEAVKVRFSTSSIFARPGPLRLLSVSKTQI